MTQQIISFQTAFAPFINTIKSNDDLDQQYKRIINGVEKDMNKLNVVYIESTTRQFYQYQTNLTMLQRQDIRNFVIQLISHYLSAQQPSPCVEFDFIYNTTQYGNNTNLANVDNEQYNLPPLQQQQQQHPQQQHPQQHPSLQNPISIMQFNILADHLSGSHPKLGGFDNIDIKLLEMDNYRKWKLLYFILETHHFVLPQSKNDSNNNGNNITNTNSSVDNNNHDNNNRDNNNTKKDCSMDDQSSHHNANTNLTTNNTTHNTHQISTHGFINDIIALEELDQYYYLTFFGPILAFCGYNSSYTPKHLHNAVMTTSSLRNDATKTTILNNQSTSNDDNNNNNNNNKKNQSSRYFTDLVINPNVLDVVGDGTALFSVYKQIQSNYYHLGGEQQQIAVGAFLQVPKYQSSSPPPPPPQQQQQQQPEQRQNLNPLLTQNVLENPCGNIDTRQYHYIFVVGTHLKAAKDKSGELIRFNQIKQLYSDVNKEINDLIQNYPTSSQLQEKFPGLMNINIQDGNILCQYNNNNNNDNDKNNDKNNQDNNNNNNNNNNLDRINLSVIICGDFNAAPYYSDMTPYPPYTYTHCHNNDNDTVKSDLKVMKSDNNELNNCINGESNSSEVNIGLKSVYSDYDLYYKSYCDNNNNHNNDIDVLQPTRFNKIQPPISSLDHFTAYEEYIAKTSLVKTNNNHHDQSGNNNNNNDNNNETQPTYTEAPWTTMKTRAGKLSKHTIDYIWFNQKNNDQKNNDQKNVPQKSLYQLQLVGIGTIPDPKYFPVSAIQWLLAFPSDHLPIIALFDL